VSNEKGDRDKVWGNKERELRVGYNGWTNKRRIK
jgi:hypothetical protein